jgi:hypothetical protein
MLPELASIMSDRGKGDYRLDWLSGET